MDKEEKNRINRSEKIREKIIQRRENKLNPIHILRDNWGEYCFNETRMIDWSQKTKKDLRCRIYSWKNLIQ